MVPDQSPDNALGRPEPAEAEGGTHDRRSLDRSLFTGIAWTFLSRWTAQFISWGVMLYVARVLTPDDFGLAAMAAVPIGLARLVEDLGIDSIVVQDRTLTHDQIAELGGLAIVVGVLLCFAFLMLAMPVASFFREPAVAGLIAILSLTFVADAVQVLPRAMLQRDLAYRRLAAINAIQLTVGAVALGGYAAVGLKAWSLALNTLTSSIVITVVLLLVRPHRIRKPRALRQLARPLTSAGQLMLSRLAWYSYANLDQTFVGRMLGKADLGAYSFAMTFAALPVQEVTSLVGKVIPGIFSTVQHDLPSLRRYFLLLTEAISYLTMPAAIGLALVADDFVRIAIGPQWSSVVAPLRLLAVYMAVNSAQVLFSHVVIWTGHFRLNLVLNLYAVAVLPPAFYIGAHFGLVGVGWAWVIAYPVTILPVLYISHRLLVMRPTKWLQALAPALAACAVMALAVLLCRLLLPVGLAPWRRLAVEAGIGALTYVAVLFTLFRRRVTSILVTVWGRDPPAVGVLGTP
jgi:teichuronic acid exporter